MKIHRRSSFRSRRAFTIIELLVAIGVTAVLVTLMVTITLNVLNAWNRSSGRLAANATARLVLDQLAQDLSGVIMRRDGNVWLAATVQRNQTTARGDTGMDEAHWTYGTRQKPVAANGSLRLSGTGVNTIADCRFGQAGVWLRFFSTPPAENSGSLDTTSAPRAISWQIVRRQLGGTVATSQYSYHLFRSEVRPFAVDDPGTSSTDEGDDNVFRVGYDLYMNPAAAISYNNGNAAMAGNVGNVRRPHADQLIGVDVIDFGVKFYERNSAGNLVETFPGTPPPASLPFSYAATSDTTKSLAIAGNSIYGFPEEAEIMVRVLTAEGARLIAAFEEGNLQRDTEQFANDDEFWWDIAEKHSIVFTRRVAIQPKAF